MPFLAVTCQSEFFAAGAFAQAAFERCLALGVGGGGDSGSSGSGAAFLAGSGRASSAFSDRLIRCLGIDREDFHLNFLALGHDVAGAMDPLMGQLADMNHALDARFQLHERPEFHDLRDGPLHVTGHGILGRRRWSKDFPAARDARG